MSNGELQVPAVAPRKPKDICFFTTGDDRMINSPFLNIRTEEMWRQRAEALAPGEAHGVTTRAEALQVLKDFKGSIREAFFLGHGTADDVGAFFFSGRPDPEFDFTGNDDQILEMSRANMMDFRFFDENKEFLITLFQRLHTNGLAKISFLACFLGQGELHRACCDFLDGWLVAKKETRFRVGAYEDFYETVFTTDNTGAIIQWEDRIVTQPGTLPPVVPNPGPNRIPPFQVECSGVMAKKLGGKPSITFD